MAIIHCPECHREISDKAVSCPHCGFPLQEHMMRGAEQSGANQSNESSTNNNGSDKGLNSANEQGSTNVHASTNAHASMNGQSQGQPVKKGRAGATIAVVSLVIIALLGMAAWFLFLRGGSDDDERLAFENITRYEQENKLDSLADALHSYFDMYNADAYHYSQLKDLDSRFSTENADWQAVAKLSSIDAIHHFLDDHPDGFFRSAANQKLDSLSYEEAEKEDTKEAYEKYITMFSDGKFVKDAEQKMSDLDRKELTVEESSGVKTALTNHFDALSENDRVALSMTLAHSVNSYLNKNNPTEEDIYQYMEEVVNKPGRYVQFSVKDAQVTKVDAGNKSVFNVRFMLEESIYSTRHDASNEEDEEEPSPTSVKKFQGTAVMNETRKITSLVLKTE